MARIKAVQDIALLEAALTGLELQRQRIDEQILEVRTRLGRKTGRKGRPPVTAAAGKETSKRVLSPAARKRIAAAQKRRWAEFRKTNPEPET